MLEVARETQIRETKLTAPEKYLPMSETPAASRQKSGKYNFNGTLVELETLHAHEVMYRKVTETIRDAIITFDDKGKIRLWNKAAEKTFGYTLDEALGQSIDITLPVNLRGHQMMTGCQPSLERVAYNLPSRLLEAVACHKDGHEFPVEYTVSMVQVGKEMLFTEVLRDVSQKKAEADYETQHQQLEAIGTLAGGIAHDFNNLLTVILGGISLARLATNSHEMTERLQEAENGCLRAADLAKQLLTFARGGAPMKEFASLEEVVRETAASTLASSQSTYRVEVQPNLWPTEIDRGQVSQMIQNILINADQSMPEGGVIEITLTNASVEKGELMPLPAGPYLKLAITDHGDGIPKQNLGKIFNPYFTTKPKGRGLGLTIVSSIARRHGGTVRAESEAGAGCTFTVYLPASTIKAKPIGQPLDNLPVYIRHGRYPKNIVNVLG
jgi:PAS domain S-box-containing protein